MKAINLNSYPHLQIVANVMAKEIGGKPDFSKIVAKKGLDFLAADREVANLSTNDVRCLSSAMPMKMTKRAARASENTRMVLDAMFDSANQ